ESPRGWRGAAVGAPLSAWLSLARAPLADRPSLARAPLAAQLSLARASLADRRWARHLAVDLAPQLPGVPQHLVHRVDQVLRLARHRVGVEAVLEHEDDRVALDLAHGRLPEQRGR